MSSSSDSINIQRDDKRLVTASGDEEEEEEEIKFIDDQEPETNADNDQNRKNDAEVPDEMSVVEETRLDANMRKGNNIAMLTKQDDNVNNNDSGNGEDEGDTLNYEDEIELRNLYQFVPRRKKTIKSKIKKKRVGFSCCCNFLFSLFPILGWLPRYKVKEYLVGDIIGGLTTAIVRIPQSLAYGLLAGVQPINGLYTAFFAPLTYAFLGTSKHVSVGTFAIMSLMLESAVEEYEMAHPLVVLANNASAAATTESTSVTSSMMETTMSSGDVTHDADHVAYRLRVVTSLTCLIGIFQILLGLLRLGFVSVFLSDPLVSAFTCASAFHVFTTQIKSCFGLTIPRQPQPFAIVKTYVELFSHITEANTTTIVVAVISIAILYPIKIINVKYKEKLRSIPIPVELFVVVVATIVSSATGLHERHQVEVVGDIVKGLPAAMAPDPSLWGDLVSSAFSISIVGFAMTVSLGKLFAKKHHYTISPNHELFALGVSQIVCSSFQGHACAGALARSSVKESSGTKTQLSDFVSCLVILLVLLVFGPYLSSLPKTCLACIIIVNLRSLFLHFDQLPRLYKLSKFDFLIWIVTFAATLLIGVDTGLFIGVVFLLSSVVLRIYHPDVSVRGRLGQTTIYRDLKTFKQAQGHSGVRIIRFSQSPFFANKEAIQQLGEQLEEEISGFSRRESCERWEASSPPDDRPTTSTAIVQFDEELDEFHTVIFDCSAWSIVDTVGMEAVKQLCKVLSNQSINVSLVNVESKIVDKLILADVFKPDESFIKIFPNVHSAVTAACNSQNSKRLVIRLK